MALVLAAGRSRRMGADKAARRVDGEPVLERLDRLVSALDLEPVYSLRPDQTHLAPAGRRVLHDRWADAGPLGGIATALDALPDTAILALAVDMPDLGPEHLRGLMEPPLGARARCLSAAGERHPLPSAWPAAARESVVAAVEAGRLAVHAALDEVGVETVPVDESAMSNINFPDQPPGGRGASMN